MKQKGNNPLHKVLFGKNNSNSVPQPSLSGEVCDLYGFALQKAHLSGQLEEGAEGGRETQTQKGEEIEKENGAETKSRPSTRRLSREESQPAKAGRDPAAGDSGSPLPPLGGAAIWGSWGPWKGGPEAARWEQWGR